MGAGCVTSAQFLPFLSLQTEPCLVYIQLVFEWTRETVWSSRISPRVYLLYACLTLIFFRIVNRLDAPARWNQPWFKGPTVKICVGDARQTPILWQHFQFQIYHLSEWGNPQNRGPAECVLVAQTSELSFFPSCPSSSSAAPSKYFVKGCLAKLSNKHCKTVDTLHKMRRRACLNSLCLLR